jgi:putrescine transport system ATP-binding protein
VVTHDQEEAMTLASRIGVMNQGRIVQVGTPHEIYEFPATRFVADFIGNVNMFEGRIVEDEADHVVIDSAELGTQIYVGHGVSAAPDAVVWTAIRPEKIQLARDRPTGRFNNVDGTIKEIAYMGDLSVYIVQLASGKAVRVTEPNTFRHVQERYTWEDKVWLSWHESSAVVVTQ